MIYRKRYFLQFYKIALVIVFCFNEFNIYAQIDFTDLEFNTVEKNIFQRPITTLVKDANGFLWIGTDGAGLYKYNGFSYTYFGYNINDSNSINSNSVTRLFLDSSKQLWVGTDAGLCVYNEDENFFRRIKTSYDTSENAYVSILCYAEYENRFLLGTYDGIKLLDTESGVLKHYGLGGYGVLDLQFSAKGNLYAATNQGLKVERYHQLGEFEEVNLRNDTLQEHVTRLHIDKHEVLWVGTLKSGTFKTDLKKPLSSFDKLDIVDSAVMAIIGGLDHVFVAVENEGLFVLNQKGDIIKHYLYNVKNLNGVGSDSVWSLLFDDENRLWLGYYENGLGYFDSHYSKFESIKRKEDKNSIHTNEIKAFAKTKNGNIWIAQTSGIDILNTSNGKLTNVYGKQNSEYQGLKKGLYIEDIFIDSKGNTWIATWGAGLFFSKKGSKTFVNFNKSNTSGVLKTNKVRSFAEDASGKIWIGSFLEGVFYFDYKTGKIHVPNGNAYANSELINKDVIVIHNDSAGYIWVGTSSGLYQIENQNNSEYVITAYGDSISSKFAGHPSSKRILDIYETQDGTLWCGTNGGGLFKFNRHTKHFETFYLQGFDLSFVNAIFEPIKNELWVSSKQGVLKINRNTEDVIQYTVNDGLLENFLSDRAVILDNNNNLYLGTKSGVNFISPQNIVYNPYLAKPYLKGVKLSNKAVNKRDKDSPLTIKNGTNTISLKHDQRIITIDYGAISFTRPEKNHYAYLLEGFEKNWNYVGSKMNATYTNLEPGDYTFKLKASNNDNLWNQPSTILKIQVQPPWWKTVWAYVSYVICFSILVFTAMFYYRKRINERNTFRLERERRKQKVELQQQKLQFFTNISHEFRTPLTLIINPIKELIEAPNLDVSKSIKEKYHIIYKNASRLSRLINELMDFRKLQSNKLQLKVSQFNIVESTKNILSFFNEEAKRRSIQLDLKHESKAFSIWADKGILDKVLFNLLSNAFKVTPNKGKIRAKIVSSKSKILPLVNENMAIPVVEISVKDNGPGIDQKDYNKIFERFYQVGELNKSYYGSTGVGLDMVKNFVKLHKGVIEVESELGKGSNFKVFLPYEKEHFHANEFTSVVIDNVVPLSSNSKPKTYSIEEILAEKELKKKLLVIEDNIDLQDYLVSILKEDYDVIIAADGQEGWLKTMEHHPDVIITDFIMPIMDGIEFCKKVKGNSSLNRIPIVMLTAKNLPEDRIKAIKGGADAYVVKPFDNNELLVILEELLAKKERLIENHVSTTPLNQKKKEVADLDNDFIQKVLEFIYQNIENPTLNVETLSSHLCLSRSQVYRKIKVLTGLSPIQFIRRVRLERSRVIFENDKNLNVSEVAHKVGFLSSSYFTVCYKKQFGELPKSKKGE